MFVLSTAELDWNLERDKSGRGMVGEWVVDWELGVEGRRACLALMAW